MVKKRRSTEEGHRRKFLVVIDDTPESTRTVKVSKDGRASVAVPMHSNDVVLVTLTKTAAGSGRR